MPEEWQYRESICAEARRRVGNLTTDRLRAGVNKRERDE